MSPPDGAARASPHVADVSDYGELPSGEPFIVMEYLEGESLARIFQRDGTIPEDRLAMIADQILDALAAARLGKLELSRQR